MYYKGLYHLFYQYNPKGAVWGNIVWAHSVSSDMINWRKLEHAIYPSKTFDQYGCWSGSATILPGNKPIILYTGIVDQNNTQVQNYAVPADVSDPFLRDWVKPDDNPLISADESINGTAFRDPTTAWWSSDDGHWRIAIGGLRKRRGMAFLYRSRDFKHWVKAQHPLHSRNGTGNWECPDLYPVSTVHMNGLDSSTTGPHVKHVLKVSLDLTRYEYYTLGTYDVAAKDRYIPDEGMIDGWKGLRLDYGNFYASKSFYDPAKRRRIVWGWANESDTTDDSLAKGWAGIQLIPRSVVLDPSGKQLLLWPIEEVETLRMKKAGLFNWELSKGEKVEIKGITSAQADVDVTFSFDSLENAEAFNSSWDRYDAQKLCGQKDSTVEGALGPFGLITLASQNLEEYTPVFFRIFKDQHKHLLLMCSDASRYYTKDGKDAYRPSFGGFVDVDLEEKKISLRSLIDNSVVESFAARGKTCITSRVYPQLALDGNAHFNGVEASHKVFRRLQSVSAVDVKQHHRTGYHFQPTRHWINGPMYFNGIYHLFYQYNPKGAVWGNIVWAHSVSTDLINWKKVEHAIYPSKPFDKYGCWSGSATVLPGNKPIILYTGIVDQNNTQVQNYVVPENISDPYLRKWIKPDNNPLIVGDEWVNKTAFRDPTTAWMGRDGQWRITIGGREEETGVSFLYKSRDFMHWERVKRPLHSIAGSGNWECPDFYPVSVKGGLDASVMGRNVKHVFKVSLDTTRYDYYTLGTYLIKKDMYVPDKDMIDGWNGLRYDYGNLYASKSFFDPVKSRRIVWGWANESDTTENDIHKGWAGIQLIPRTVVLDPNGKQLLQWPIEEVETLRSKQVVELSNEKMLKGQKLEIKGITAAQADVDVTFSFDSLDKAEAFDESWDRYDADKMCGHKGSTVEGGLGPFGLITLASQNLEEYTPVFFRVFKDKDNQHLVLMCSDASRSTLRDGKSHMKDGKDAYKPSFAGFVNVELKEKKLSLRSLIDNSVVESFGGGGKTVITSRVYPTLATYGNAHLYAFNNGTEAIKIDNLKAWSMSMPHEMNQ
ncbi:hypothetical protein ACS0TY_015830 [Phlomoides rotata]